MKRRRTSVLCIIFVIFVIALIAFWRWHQPLSPVVEEVQNRVVTQSPIGFSICDLNRDGNDEILITVTPVEAYVVTLHRSRLVSFPVPLLDVKTRFPKGHRLIGRTVAGEIAVAEWQSSGNWKIQILALSGSNYDVGDVDGSGEDDDAFVISGGRVLWFQRQFDGQWKYVGELRLPVGKVTTYLGVEKWGVKLGLGTSLLPLIFWDGQWKVGKPDEQVYLFRANWDGKSERDQLLVRYLPKSGEITFLLWFSRMVGQILPSVKGLGVRVKFSEIGTFQPDGRWKPEFRWQGIVRQPKQLADLDGDGHPEFLGLLEGGLISQQPILWRRLKSGEWRPVRLTTPSLYRGLGKMVNFLNPSFFVDADQLFLVQWHGKKWFVIFWDDGFIQAVTLKRQ